MRPQHTLRLTVLLAGALAASSLGCKVTAADIETWKGTVKGPGKIVAVMLSDNYDLELRTKAALALVEMERNDVDGVAELQRALSRVDQPTRAQIVERMVPGLEELMRGADTANQDNQTGPPPLQIRAKDAAYLLITNAEGDVRNRLVEAVVGWYVDFNGRSLAGNYSAEQVIRSLGTQAADMLVDAMNAEMPQPALVKVAELISQLGSDQTKQTAAERLVEIETRMESDEFKEWLKGKVVEAMREQSPDVDFEEERIQTRVNAIATLNRENFINDGALPAMKHLAAQDVVASRLLVVAENTEVEGLSEDAIAARRQRALQALEGHAKEAHLDRLLELALSEENPTEVRDYAFDRVGDIRSPRAIPHLWPLVENAEDEGQRIRWRAGEMVLAIGGPDVVAEFFEKLPVGEGAVKYEPEELEGYATRMGQMTPPPTSLMRTKLRSERWFDQVIALRYFERKGEESDIRSMQRLTRSNAAVKGERWEDLELEDVGDVAEAAIEGLRERLSGGGGEEDGAEEGAEGEGSE